MTAFPVVSASLLPPVLIDDIRTLNRRYLMLARELARIDHDLLALQTGIPVQLASAMKSLSLDPMDAICVAAGNMLLPRARWTASEWQRILQSSRMNIPAPAAILTDSSTVLPPALIDDIRTLNRRYLMLARELARIDHDLLALQTGIPVQLASAMDALSMDGLDTLCATVGNVLLPRACWTVCEWQRILQSSRMNTPSPVVILAACLAA